MDCSQIHRGVCCSIFTLLKTVNSETRRLANTQGEIRVGPSHQAKLPLLKPTKNDELYSLREDLLWKTKISDLDLSMYLQAARSIAAFAGMCDRGLPEDMYEVVRRDETTINALTTLHNHDYDCARALQALVKCPIPKSIDRKWSDDDQKKFIKGLRQYGKNFFRIRKDLLPHKQTSDLVEFYYLWKKTPQAQSSRPRRRQRPCSNLSTTPTPAKQRNAKTNNKDESEQNSDNDDNQTTTDSDEQFCRHCQINSKDLQIFGRENRLLCYDCRMFLKKHGEMPIINSESSSRYLFKPLNDSTSKRKRTKPPSSPEENLPSSLTRSKKKTRGNSEKLSTIKQEIDEEEETVIIKKEIKSEEQENEKPSSTSTSSSSLHIKTEDLNSTIATPTPCKQELHSPKILNDYTKQNNPNLLLSSPSSAFSRTANKSLLPKHFDEYDSSNKKSLLTGDVTSINSSKDNDISDDEGNTSDCSTNGNQEANGDQGPAPLSCDRGSLNIFERNSRAIFMVISLECYNKSQGIVLLQVYDRAVSQNSCARTDIVLKRGSRARTKLAEKQQQPQQQQQDFANPLLMNIKQEDRNLSVGRASNNPGT